jgi:hypothetical protein
MIAPCAHLRWSRRTALREGSCAHRGLQRQLAAAARSCSWRARSRLDCARPLPPTAAAQSSSAQPARGRGGTPRRCGAGLQGARGGAHLELVEKTGAPQLGQLTAFAGAGILSPRRVRRLASGDAPGLFADVIVRWGATSGRSDQQRNF